MELPYRVLCKKLREHPLVKHVTSDYYNIIVTWKSGIIETWMINRKERIGHIFKRKLPPVVIPVSKWWEEISNEKRLVKAYKFGINEIEHDVSAYPGFAIWSWDEYMKLGFYEQKIFVHELLQFILDNGWVNYSYNDAILNNSLQLVYNEPPKNFKYGRGWKLGHAYGSKEKPGHKLIDHFIPLARYGKFANGNFLNKRTRFYIQLLYKGIVNLIRFNKRVIKLGEKPKYPYFDYDSIMANMCFLKKRTRFAKTRPITLYRSIIKEFGMSGKSMYDFEPYYGEKSIAAFVEECSYYYRPTCPFDMGAEGLAKFLGTTFSEDHGGHYDFAIIDFNFKFNINLFKIVMERVYPKVDSLIMFVDNFNIEEITKMKKPIKSVPIRVSRFNMINGYFIQY